MKNKTFDDLLSVNAAPKNIQPCDAIHDLLAAQKPQPLRYEERYGPDYFEQSEQYWKAQDNYMDSVKSGGGTFDFGKRK